MSQDNFIPVADNAKSRNELVERGFSRLPLRIDVDIARSLEELAHAAWSIPKDKYYDGGDRLIVFVHRAPSSQVMGYFRLVLLIK